MTKQTMELYNKYGPIITDIESDKISKDVVSLLDKHDLISIDFEKVMAMTTKGAKNIFGNLYVKLKSDEFYRRVHIKNASTTIKEIIYDSISSTIKNQDINN